MNAQDAAQLSEKSKLTAILDAIKERAAEGERFLELYNYEKDDIGFFYFNEFEYGENELNELKRLGYNVTVDFSRPTYEGHLWWRKKTGQNDYHKISW